MIQPMTWSDLFYVARLWTLTLTQIGIEFVVLVSIAWLLTKSAELAKRVIPERFFLYVGAALFSALAGALLLGAATAAVILTIG